MKRLFTTLVVLVMLAIYGSSCGGGSGSGGDSSTQRPIPAPPVFTDSTQRVEMNGMIATVLKDASGLPEGVQLTWTRQADASGGYNVYRHTSAMSAGLPDSSKKITSTPIPNPGAGASVTYDDKDFNQSSGGNQPPTWGSTYYYRITNINDTSDESDVSNELNITIGGSITSFDPGSATILDAIDVNGSGFGGTQKAGDKVQFSNGSGGWLDATINSWSATKINANVPKLAKTGNVRVVLENTQYITSTGSFTVNGPTITSLSSSSGRVGDEITITGTNFEATRAAGDSYVSFGTVQVSNAGDYTSWSATQIKVLVPTNAVTAGDVTVTVGANTSTSKSFTVLPKITSISPDTQEIGNSITINGYTFQTTKGANDKVFFGATEAGGYGTWTATSIVVNVPSGISAAQNVKVQLDGSLDSNLAVFHTKPTISSLDNNRKTKGDVLTIIGNGFGGVKGTSKVTFDCGTSPDVDAVDFTSWAQTKIEVKIPDSAKTGNVVVTVDGVSSSGQSITIVLPPPDLTDADQL